MKKIVSFLIPLIVILECLERLSGARGTVTANVNYRNFEHQITQDLLALGISFWEVACCGAVRKQEGKDMGTESLLFIAYMFEIIKN